MFQGKLDKSIEKLEAILAKVKQLLPEGEKVIFKIQNDIADLYCESGQADKSALICDKIAEIISWIKPFL